MYKHRCMFAILIFLILCFIPMCKGPAGPVGPEDESIHVEHFIGTWINEDEDTRGITKIVIRANSQTIFVHMWGRCHPTDCDWGEETTDIADAYDDQLSLEWSPGFKIEKQEVYYLDYVRLKVDCHIHFIDNSGRQDYDATYYFAKD